MSELARQQQHYSAVKQRLFGKPEVVNVAWLEKRERERAEQAEIERQEKARQVEEENRRRIEAAGAMPLYALGLPLSDFSTEITIFVSEIGYGKPEIRKPTLQIIREVLQAFPGVSVDDIKGSRRTDNIVKPRQLAMYEVYRQRPDMSYPAIARIFNRDHTTVMHAVKKIEKEKA